MDPFAEPLRTRWFSGGIRKREYEKEVSERP
jgi:hypothetical protein